MFLGKKVGIMIHLLAISLLLTSCRSERIQTYYFNNYFDTTSALYVYGRIDDDTVAGVESILSRLEKVFSLGSEFASVSEVQRINSNPGKFTKVSKVVLDLLTKAIQICDMSVIDGRALFDVTMLPVSKLWDFENGTIPSDDEIQKALEMVNFKNIEIASDYVKILDDMAINLDSLSKAYAVDIILRYLKARGISNAVISVGSYVYLCESKNIWPYAKVYNPDILKQDEYFIGEVSISNKALVSINKYQKYINNDSKVHYILDPRTGYPASNNVISVSVIAESAVLAAGLSFILFVMGLDEGLKYVEGLEDVDVVFVVENGDDKEIYTSSGILFYFNENAARLGYKLIEK